MRLTLIAVVVLIAWNPDLVSGQATSTQPRGAEVTLRTPEPERLEIALDEVVLRWRDERRTEIERRPPAADTGRTTVQRTDAAGAVFAMRDVATVEDANSVAIALEKENPGATAHLVLYEAGRPRSEGTRRLLGRDVAVIVAPAVDASALFAQFPDLPVRSIPSVSGAYVVTAPDPLGAIAVSDRLSAMPGVTSAYPLLQQRQFSR